MLLLQNKQSFIVRYTASNVKQYASYILKRLFDRDVEFMDFENNKTRLDRIIFLSGQPSIIGSYSELLARGLPKPFCVVFDEKIMDRYEQPFLGQFHASGFEQPLIKLYLAARDDSLINLSDNNTNVAGYTNFQIEIVAHVTRLPYQMDLALHYSTQAQMIESQTTITNLFTVGRYHLIKIPYIIYLPRELFVATENNDLLGSIDLYNTLRDDTETVKVYPVSGQTNQVGLVINMHAYVRIDAASWTQNIIVDSQEQTFRSDWSVYVDMPYIKFVDLITYIPIRGVIVKIFIKNDVTAEPLLVPTSINDLTLFHIQEINIDSFYARDTFVIDIPTDINLSDTKKIEVINFSSQITDPGTNFIGGMLIKKLEYTLDSNNGRIQVLNEVYPGKVRVYYWR
jgi:hypothetical protein